MGKRHKRRRMVQKVQPHRGPVILTEIRTARLEATVLVARIPKARRRAMERAMATGMDRMAEALVTAATAPGPMTTSTIEPIAPNGFWLVGKVPI